MSIVTTSSARPFCTIRIAAVAPTNPLPTTVTSIDRLPWNVAYRKESYGFLRGGGDGELGGRGGRRDRAVDRAQASLLQHQQEVVRLGRGVQRVVDSDLA